MHSPQLIHTVSDLISQNRAFHILCGVCVCVCVGVCVWGRYEYGQYKCVSARVYGCTIKALASLRVSSGNVPSPWGIVNTQPPTT